jgi:hypothetical protein
MPGKKKNRIAKKRQQREQTEKNLADTGSADDWDSPVLRDAPPAPEPNPLVASSKDWIEGSPARNVQFLQGNRSVNEMSDQMKAMMELPRWKEEKLKAAQCGRYVKGEDVYDRSPIDELKANLDANEAEVDNEAEACIDDVYGVLPDGDRRIATQKAAGSPGRPGETLPACAAQVPGQKRFDYKQNGYSGFKQFAPFFVHGKDELSGKALRLLNPLHVKNRLGDIVFHTLGDSLQNFVKQGHFPGAGPGEVFRHVVTVHVCRNLPCADLQNYVTKKSYEINDAYFLEQLLAKDLRDWLGISLSVADDEHKGTFCVVLTQCWLAGMDVWRIGNTQSPVNQKIMDAIMKRMRRKARKIKGRGHRPFSLGDGLDAPLQIDVEPSPEEVAEEEKLDEEFASLDFNKVMNETKNMSFKAKPAQRGEQEEERQLSMDERLEMLACEIDSDDEAEDGGGGGEDDASIFDLISKGASCPLTK